MKIGIITFHFPYNCGAALQCMALQTKLESLGHEVYIINYRPWYHQNRYTPIKNPVYWGKRCFDKEKGSFLRKSYKGAKGFAKAILSWSGNGEAKIKEQKFRSFVKNNLHETRVYRTLKQLQDNPPACDVYISGSDQLWNCGLTEGEFDAAYFLKFGQEKTGRMTYSVGTNFTGLEHPEEVLKNLVKDIDFISIRENKWRSVLEKATGENKEIHTDLDPTLLLDKSDYESKIPNMTKTEPFILTYSMPNETQKQINNGARLLSKELGMKVIDICGNPNGMNKKADDNRICGPDEFLWYIKNADYVLTNSFHGTAFSLIFEKQFMVIPHSATGNRATELLDKVGLTSRYKKITAEAVDEMQTPIDYTAVRERINELRGESVNYLTESLAKLKGEQECTQK